jgi:lipopolysaccharide/colanic/teichoic acid biosynthesis glycosyltransferase
MIWGFLGVLLAIALPVITKVLGDDARTGIPKLAAAIIRQAARRLPAEHHERWTEEWLAALGEMEERSVMLWHALGCYFVAAPRVRDELAEFQSYRSKRVLDLVVAIITGIVLLPLYLLLILLVSIDGGPLLCTQTLIGAGGRPFQALRLRTIRLDGDAQLIALLERDAHARKEWLATGKLRNDPRVTSIGRFLRRTSLDLLPQLLNVIRGDMTLLGPRGRSADQRPLQRSRVSSIPPGFVSPWAVSDVADDSALEEERLRRMSLGEYWLLLLKIALVGLRGK